MDPARLAKLITHRHRLVTEAAHALKLAQVEVTRAQHRWHEEAQALAGARERLRELGRVGGEPLHFTTAADWLSACELKELRARRDLRLAEQARGRAQKKVDEALMAQRKLERLRDRQEALQAEHDRRVERRAEDEFAQRHQRRTPS